MATMQDNETQKDGVLAKARQTHALKCWPEFFEEIAAGRKRHDLRRADDRFFQVGDRIRLKEFEPVSQMFTGREQIVEITYITSAEKKCALSDQALHPKYCILSIAPLSA